MKAATQRTRLGRVITLSTRESIFQTAEGIEVDSVEQFELIRRRVLYEDVQLVTYHRERGLAFLLTTGIVAAFFIGLGLLIGSIGSEMQGAAVFLVIGFVPLIAFLLRFMFGADVITVFGRRSRARLRFGVRKARARQVYGSICAAVRNAQRIRPTTMPGVTATPLPAGVPMPPATPE
jgi:hypothetical protein